MSNILQTINQNSIKKQSVCIGENKGKKQLVCLNKRAENSLIVKYKLRTSLPHNDYKVVNYKAKTSKLA